MPDRGPGAQGGAFLCAELATLVGEARSANPTALGGAFGQLEEKPRVCAAYDELSLMLMPASAAARPRVRAGAVGDGKVW